jgi:hypothetical protein
MSSEHCCNQKSEEEEEAKKEKAKKEKTKEKSLDKNICDECEDVFPIVTIQHHLFSKNRSLTTSFVQKTRSSLRRMCGSALTAVTHLVPFCNGKRNWRGLWI